MDIPDLADALVQAKQHRKQELYLHAMQDFLAIEQEFMCLLEQFPLLPNEGLGLGGGMAFGDIHLAIYKG